MGTFLSSQRFHSPLYSAAYVRFWSLRTRNFGLAQGDFELALRGLLGEGAPLSPSSIERLRAKWQLEYEAWRSRRLENLELVYVWADGLYVKAGLEDSKAALLVIIGAL